MLIKYQILLGRPVTLPSHKMLLLIIHNNNHPHANLPIIRQQRRTMDPAVSSTIAESRDPLDSSSNTATCHHSMQDTVPLFTCIANP